MTMMMTLGKHTVRTTSYCMNSQNSQNIKRKNWLARMQHWLKQS